MGGALHASVSLRAKLAELREVLVESPIPGRSKINGQTGLGFCTRLTTLSCKKPFVTETATSSVHK